MDGVRIAAGWVRELQGRWLGSIGVDWRSAAVFSRRIGPSMALCGSCDARDGERIRQGTLADRGGTSLRGSWALQAGSQAGSGMARSRAMAAELGFPRPMLGKIRVRRRAERVITVPPGEEPPPEGLVVAIRSPRPMRAVQRARLCAIAVPPARRRGGEAP